MSPLLSRIVCIEDSYPVGFIREGKTFIISKGTIIEKYSVMTIGDLFNLTDQVILSINGSKDFMVFEDWRNHKIDTILE
jgi:hypothetical protein